MTRDDMAWVAIQQFGLRAQLRQLQEECCELGAAVNRYVRRRSGSEQALVAEAAQVFLCLSYVSTTWRKEFAEAVAREEVRLLALIGGDQ